MHRRGQHIGCHGDNAARAQRHHRIGLIVVSGVDSRAGAEGGEALHLFDVSRGFLDAADHRVLEQFRHHLRRHVHARARRHVVGDDGNVHAVGDGPVVRKQPLAAGLVVVGRHHEQPVRAQCLCLLRAGNGCARVVRARADDQRHAPRHAGDGALDQRRALHGRDGAGFARGAQHDDGVRKHVDLPVDERLQSAKVDLAPGKRRDQRHAAAVKQRVPHKKLPLPAPIYGKEGGGMRVQPTSTPG